MLFNYERAAKKMEAHGLDALIASSCENVNYCADFETNNTYRYKYGRVRAHCVLLRDQILKPVLITPVDLLAHLAVIPSWVEDIRTYGTFYLYGGEQEKLGGAPAQLNYLMNHCRNYPQANAALLDVLREKGLANGRIGWDENNLSPNAWEFITASLPNARIRKAAGIFKEIRMVKTEEEILRIRESVQISDAAAQAVIDRAEAGIPEVELQKAFRRTVTEGGAFFGFFVTAAGPTGGALFPVPPSNHILAKGDSIRYDAGCIHKSYWSDTGRTIFIGEPSGKQQQYFNALFAGICAAETLVKAGVRVSEIFHQAVNAVREKGIPDYKRHHIGHSMGLETYEPPMFFPSDRPVDSDIYLPEEGIMTLEENMVINLECPYYDLQMGGMQFEETYLVKKDGYVRLSTLKRGASIR
jgi:Xaa-Pro dipeptidase